jgi:hypothetical protein
MQQNINDWFTIFMQSVQGAMEMLLKFIPQFLGALVIFILGWVVAKILQKAFHKIFSVIGVDKISVKSGIRDFLDSSGFKRDLSWICARIIFWTVFLIFMLPVSDILGLSFFGGLVNQALGFVPNLIIVLLIVLVGAWAAKIISGMVKGSSTRLGSDYSQILATVVNVTVLLITFIVALSQLSIDASIISNILLIVVGAMCVGLAIAFGLGSKEIIKNVIAGIYLNKNLEPGSLLIMSGREVKLLHIGSITSEVMIGDESKHFITNNNLIQTTKI